MPLRLALLLCVLPSLAVAQPPPPEPSSGPIRPPEGSGCILRKGFTLELSIGPGLGYVSQGPYSGTQAGLGAVISLGGFLRPDLAMLGRIVTVNFGPFTDTLSQGVFGVFGPALEYWLDDHVSLIGGVGFAALGTEPKIGPKDSKAGLGLMFAANWFPYASEHHGLGIYIDVEPFFLAQSGGNGVLFQGGFAWQYY